MGWVSLQACLVFLDSIWGSTCTGLAYLFKFFGPDFTKLASLFLPSSDCTCAGLDLLEWTST